MHAPRRDEAMEETRATGRIADMTIAEPVTTVRENLGALLPRLRRFARALTGDVHDADDLVQVALERALSRAAQWRPEQRLDGWVFGIIRNAWIDELRARGRGRRLFTADVDADVLGSSPMEGQAALLSVQAAMATLPEEQRSAVALVLVEGLSYREAAMAHEVPVGTLTSRLARGRAALQALLDPDGGTQA
jgi:RNA polymerase sigma-70 factor (ECF subfamily)